MTLTEISGKYGNACYLPYSNLNPWKQFLRNCNCVFGLVFHFHLQLRRLSDAPVWLLYVFTSVPQELHLEF